MAVQIAVRRRGVVGVIFLVLFSLFNLLALGFLVAYWAVLRNATDGSAFASTAAGVSGVIGTSLIIPVWLCGALLLGVPCLIFRGHTVLLDGEDAKRQAAKTRRIKIFAALAIVGVFLWQISSLGKIQQSVPIESVAAASPVRAETPVIVDTLPAPTRSTSAAPQPVIKIEPTAAEAREKVEMSDFRWKKGGFDSVMLATFTFDNKNEFSVKDIEVRCEHSAKSGTTIDSNSRTIYEAVPAHSKKTIRDFGMGFIHSQAASSSCRIVSVAIGDDPTLIKKPQKKTSLPKVLNQPPLKLN
jgi:hypothetical protein